MRSLLLNPSTPQHSVSSIIQTLANPSHLTHQALKLLYDVIACHPDLAVHTAEWLPCLTMKTLVMFPGLRLDDNAQFVSLCFGESMAVRAWLLQNTWQWFGVRPALLLAMLLGLTKDPYPHLREAMLEGLVGFNECGEFRDVEW
ncbi:hypothetical protein Fmac_006049 [Flemingia macrophylla]|uniref:Uncharacterized protein n=1 Tax=Flemingia macrophylla TaxID=520843 RepID=A0ABD1N9I8_9FABA